MNKSFLGFIMMVFALFIFTIMTLFKFNNVYDMLTKNTQLSAWSLAQMEVETLELMNQVDRYLLDKTVSKRRLNLKFDILWNRYETFLTSDEMKQVRNSYDSKSTVERAFTLLKVHEQDVITGNREKLAILQQQLHAILPEVRNLMIVNFTGSQSIEHRRIIEETKTQIYISMIFILFILAYLSRRYYNHNKLQQEMAWQDPLTKLKNRNFLFFAIEKQKRAAKPTSLALFDINGFKDLNDTFSYDYGDRVLVSLSAYLRQQCALYEGVDCARVGADEFAILSTNPQLDMESCISKLATELSLLLKEMDPSHRASLSFGIATSHELSETNRQYVKRTANLFNNADFALNIAKRKTESSIIHYSQEIENEHRKKQQLATELEALLTSPDQTQLYMCFQPIISVVSSNKLGCEALIRWNNPNYGFINPEYLIRIAEEAGLAKRLGYWIMLQVKHALMHDWAPFSHRVEVAINLSDSLFDEELPEMMAAIFSGEAETNFLNSIVLEITETMTLDEVERSSNIIKRLEEINIRMALDDFGTGWSSLYNLNHMKFNKLKIDKSFVENISQHDNQHFFISAIVTLSHQLGIKVVAEGVEQKNQLERLTELGVDEFQGYYFSKPVRKEEFAEFGLRFFAEQDEKRNKSLH